MKQTVVIREMEACHMDCSYTLDLVHHEVKYCQGCWNCWLKTPGRCVYKDLDTFYNRYVAADEVVFLAKVVKGFVSANMKSLFDRMIPLFLPYVDVSTGESRHIPRYPKYPDIKFYYEGSFMTDEGKEVFEAYIYRTFDQFASKQIVVKPIESIQGVKEA